MFLSSVNYWNEIKRIMNTHKKYTTGFWNIDCDFYTVVSQWINWSVSQTCKINFVVSILTIWGIALQIYSLPMNFWGAISTNHKSNVVSGNSYILWQKIMRLRINYICWILTVLFLSINTLISRYLDTSK